MYAICIPVNDGAAQSSKLCSAVTMVHVCVHVWEWDALFFFGVSSLAYHMGIAIGIDYQNQKPDAHEYR